MKYAAIFLALVIAAVSEGESPPPDRNIELGTRRELFVDDYLIDQLEGLELVLGQPRDEGVVFAYDQAWEGRYSGYGVFMKLANDEYRYYYRGSPRIIDTPRGKDVEKQTCIAFSTDGISWQRPVLGLHEVYGSTDNNVILKEDFFTHNFAPFLDKPGTPAEERFKAIAGERFSGLVVFSSADGIHWQKMFGGRPVLQGKYLDAMNVAFWSESEQQYVFYGRIWKEGWGGTRWIARATSTDLEHWTPLTDVRILHDGKDAPVEHYYHSGMTPYFRAPHIYVSLCSQITNGKALSDQQVASLDIENPGRAKSRSGGGLMTSRGGDTLQRTFMEEFIRPPIGSENWVARCNYPVVGVVQTSEAEMSLYVDIHSGQPTRAVRRYALRLDGFASLEAPFSGGEMVTKPFTFAGKQLAINYATSSRGYLQVQFETPAGNAIDGFTLDDCEMIVGNEIERIVRFNDSHDLTALASKPVRLRVRMKDANLYSIQFQDSAVPVAATEPLNHRTALPDKQGGHLTERSHKPDLAHEDENATYMSLRTAPDEGFAEDQIGGRSRGVYVNQPQRGQAGAILGDQDAAVRFDGDSNAIRVPSTSEICDFGTALAEYTVEYWYKGESSNRRKCLLGSVNDGVNTALQVGWNLTTGRHYLLMRSQGGPENLMIASMSNELTRQLNDGQFHHVVWVVRSAADGDVSAYLDGNIDPGLETKGKSPTTFDKFQHGLAIGASNVRGVIDQHMAGTLDELALYDKALEKERISAHYRAAARESTTSYAEAVLLDQPHAFWRLGDYGADALHLLLDRRVVESTDNAAMRVGTVEKSAANPLFTEEHAWEVMYNNLYPNVIYDHDEDIYKAWFTMFVVDSAYAETTPQQRTPGTYMQRVRIRRDGLGYATSKDGLRWTKPMMDVHLWEGQKSNLVGEHMHGVGIFKDARERDPMRQYKMFFRAAGMAVRFSADGVRWGPFIPCPEIDSAGDAHNNAIWVPELKKYVGITRIWDETQSRVVGRTESQDFVHWTKAQIVLRGKKLFDIYSMPVIRYGNVYLGMASIFNEKTDHVWVELACSPDTIDWYRVAEGQPLIANSTRKGDYDWGTIYASQPIVRDGEIQLYYGGGDGGHFDWRRGYLCLATLRTDGFAGYEPIDASQVAIVTTHPLPFGSSMRITADAQDGQIVVSLIDEDDKILGRSQPVRGNVTDAPVTWKQPGPAFESGRPVRLRFEITRAKLYSFLY